MVDAYPLLAHPPGFPLFVGPDNEEGLDAAKEYCRLNNLTFDQVAIKRTKEKEILVRIK